VREVRKSAWKASGCRVAALLGLDARFQTRLPEPEPVSSLFPKVHQEGFQRRVLLVELVNPFDEFGGLALVLFDHLAEAVDFGVGVVEAHGSPPGSGPMGRQYGTVKPIGHLPFQ